MLKFLFRQALSQADFSVSFGVHPTILCMFYPLRLKCTTSNNHCELLDVNLQIDEPQVFDADLPAVSSDDVSLVRSFMPPDLLAELDADMSSLQEMERPSSENKTGDSFVPPKEDTISLLHRLLSEPLVGPPPPSAVSSLTAGAEMAASGAATAAPSASAASVSQAMAVSGLNSQRQLLETKAECEQLKGELDQMKHFVSDQSSEFRTLCGNVSELIMQQQQKLQEGERIAEPMSASVGVQSSLVVEQSPSSDEQATAAAAAAAAAAAEAEMLAWKKRAEEAAARELEVSRELAEVRSADMERQKRYDEVCAELEQLKLKLSCAPAASDTQQAASAAAPADSPDTAGASRFDNTLEGLESIPTVCEPTQSPTAALTASAHQQQESTPATQMPAAGDGLSVSMSANQGSIPAPSQHQSLSQVLVCMETLRLAMQEGVDGTQAADELVRALIGLHDEVEVSKPRRQSGSALLSTSVSGSHVSHYYEQSTVDVVTQALLLLGKFSCPNFDWSITAQNYSFLSGVSQTRSIASPSAYVFAYSSPIAHHCLYVPSVYLFIFFGYELYTYR